MRKMFKKLKYKISLIIILWKDVHEMPAVYALLIMKGARTFESVPNLIKQDVANVLVEMELEYLVPEEYLRTED